jgi:trehalose/maltose transport system permease protein
MKPGKLKKFILNALFVLILLALAFYLLFPFYWAIVSSFKSPSELFQVPVQYIPKFSVGFENYEVVFNNDDFFRGLINSTIVSLSVTALAISVGAFAAIRNPCVVVGAECTQLSMFNTRTGLVVTYLVFALPFTTWVLTNFFKSLPAELEQAALVDGATPFQTFYMVLLPLTVPAVVTTGMLAFIAAWNEFLFALTFTLDFNSRTVQPAIAFFRGASEREVPWGNIMAASVVVTVPLILLVLIFQRRIVDGLTAGAVKG